MHFFDSEVSADGRINVGFALPTIGVSTYFLHSNFDLPPLEFVKIDKDGNKVRNSKGGRDICMEHKRSLINLVQDQIFLRKKSKFGKIFYVCSRSIQDCRDVDLEET